jgi:hypothetical protein
MRESDTLSLSVQEPKFPRSRVPHGTYLAGQSLDCPDRGVVGQLGYRKATLLIPSTFYAGEVFPPATGKVEFPKSDPRRDLLMIAGICSLVNYSHAFIPPLKGVGFRLRFCKACQRS